MPCILHTNNETKMAPTYAALQTFYIADTANYASSSYHTKIATLRKMVLLPSSGEREDLIGWVRWKKLVSTTFQPHQ
jgi:hypothetical protein